MWADWVTVWAHGWRNMKIYYSGSMCEAHPFCFPEREQWANKCWLWRASLCCCITSEANLPIKGNGHDNKSINITRKWPVSETQDDRTLWQSTQNLPIPQREQNDGERSIRRGESLGSDSSWHSHIKSSYKPDIWIVPCPISTVTCDTPHAA